MSRLRRMLALGMLSRHSSQIVVTPTPGAELLVNSGFAAWTTDNPDGWTVTGESGSNPEVSQRGAGQLHASTPAGSGMANMYTTGAGIVLTQVVLTAGAWCQFETVIDGITGTLQVSDGGGNLSATYTTAGEKLQTGRVVVTAYRLRNNAGVVALDATLDRVSAKALTLSSLYRILSSSFVPVIIKVKVTRTANTQAGLIHRSDDNNFVIAYLDGAGSAKLEKRVGGTYTTVSTVTATYVEGAELELNYDPIGKTYTVKYNGATLVNAASVTDAVFVTAQEAGVFSTYAGNTFSGFTANPT